MKFDILDIDKKILQATHDMGYERCTPVQEQSLPDSLAGMDIISQSQTGTGKTAVFLITALNRLNTGELKEGRDPRALILVPTRELATQVSKEADKLGSHLSLRSIAIYGGVDYDKQIKPLKEGVDIIVATPGRLMDLYKSKTFSLDSIEMFIIDEADRMFDMGFAPDVRYIAGRLPKDKDRQTLLFSATIDYNVKSLASRYMKPDPVLVEIEPESVTVDAIDQKVLYVSNEEKLGVLMGLLKRPDTTRTIIFTNMKRTAEMLEWKLKENGLEASVLTGDVSQSKRERIMASMKAGKVNTLIATDVAARGVHIDDVTHVINYDLPEDPANYVHRIGRTARAGKSGKAYSLGCEDSVFNLPAIEEYIERKIDNEWMDEDEVVKDTAGRYRGSRSRTAGPAKKPARSGAQRSGRGPQGRTSSKSASGSRRPASRGSKPAAKSTTASSQPSTHKSTAKEPGKDSPKDLKATGAEPRPNDDRPKRPSRPRSRRPAKSAEEQAKSKGGATDGQSDGEQKRPQRAQRSGSSRRPPRERKEAESKGAQSAGGKRPSGSSKGRTRSTRNESHTKPDDTSSDARLSFYKPARGLEPSSKKRRAAAPKPKAVPEIKKVEENTSGLIKRVLKSFWKK
jgi:ATP-dependent RNA helicase RhlB